ncbi:MAG: hypothetical protein MI922_25880, partial [Bacteroidales bacterium]|nr:hypothetical protein [Bacteroidales bacterium]
KSYERVKVLILAKNEASFEVELVMTIVYEEMEKRYQAVYSYSINDLVLKWDNHCSAIMD